VRRYETVEVHRTGAAAKVVLNRPEAMNAWSNAMSDDLLTVLRELADDSDVRAVMLTGTGRGFCPGVDLKEGLAEAEATGKFDTAKTLTRWFNPIITTIREMPKPVISAVNGAAAGAGVSLALAADLVVAKESAYFLLAFVNIGLVPDAGSSLFVPARIGFARAAEMAMLGERVPAPRAADIGLINAAWPDDEFEKNAEALLHRLAVGATRAYAGIKEQLNQWMLAGLTEHLALETRIQGDLGDSADFNEGIRAFVEKRPVRFTGH
jgi:2-(1,2-epoxy-1,2-dihydrophenyl)acetyl-CoA isomerase